MTAAARTSGSPLNNLNNMHGATSLQAPHQKRHGSPLLRASPQHSRGEAGERQPGGTAEAGSTAVKPYPTHEDVDSRKYELYDFMDGVERKGPFEVLSLSRYLPRHKGYCLVVGCIEDLEVVHYSAAGKVQHVGLLLVNDPTDITKRTHVRWVRTAHDLEASKEWIKEAVGKTLLLAGFQRAGFENGRVDALATVPFELRGNDESSIYLVDAASQSLDIKLPLLTIAAAANTQTVVRLHGRVEHIVMEDDVATLTIVDGSAMFGGVSISTKDNAKLITMLKEMQPREEVVECDRLYAAHGEFRYQKHSKITVITHTSVGRNVRIGFNSSGAALACSHRVGELIAVKSDKTKKNQYIMTSFSGFVVDAGGNESPHICPNKYREENPCKGVSKDCLHQNAYNGEWECTACDLKPTKVVKVILRVPFKLKEIGVSEDGGKRATLYASTSHKCAIALIGTALDSYLMWDVDDRKSFWTPYLQSEYHFCGYVRNGYVTITSMVKISGAQ